MIPNNNNQVPRILASLVEDPAPSSLTVLRQAPSSAWDWRMGTPFASWPLCQNLLGWGTMKEFSKWFSQKEPPCLVHVK